jgi:CheY-like chemotaxis protein
MTLSRAFGAAFLEPQKIGKLRDAIQSFLPPARSVFRLRVAAPFLAAADRLARGRAAAAAPPIRPPLRGVAAAPDISESRGTCALGRSYVRGQVSSPVSVNPRRSQPMNEGNPLSGVRVLVVEDDSLLAMDLKDTVADAGTVVVGVCQTLDEAMTRADVDDFAVAVLDFSLGPDTASPLARRLVRRGVPFVLYTGKSRRASTLAEWRDCPIVQKPASPRALLSALRTVLPR